MPPKSKKRDFYIIFAKDRTRLNLSGPSTNPEEVSVHITALVPDAWFKQRILETQPIEFPDDWDTEQMELELKLLKGEEP